MNILLISQSFHPNIGGVEKHLEGLIPQFQKQGHQVKILTTKNRKELKDYEIINQLEIHRFTYPQKKLLGLLKIYWELFKKIKLIKEADEIHIHDVFIYYLPFRFLFPKKKIATIFHGWETEYPIPYKNIFYKKLAQKLSNKTISIGHYINKYYGLSAKNNTVVYGAINHKKLIKKKKKKNSFVFLGRLEKDTGLEIFLKTLDELKKEKLKFSVIFCGDGSLRKKAEKYGIVKGFTDPNEELAQAEYCFAGGYLSILEALAHQNIVLSAYDNPLKKDYYLLSPFADFMISADNAKDIVQKIKNKKLSTFPIKEYSFEKLSQIYLQ